MSIAGLQASTESAKKSGPETRLLPRPALTTTQGTCDMADSSLPPLETLRQLLDYSPETGELVWKERPVEMFNPSPLRGGMRSAQWACNHWNSRHAGKPALTSPSKGGHRGGTLFRKRYLAHRVIWYLYYGEAPDGQIDHINGVGSDNRIVNLRVVSNLENSHNRGISANNKSGHSGVSWALKEKKWVAQIRVGDRRVRLGAFHKIEDAVIARRAAEKTLGYHPNHGQRPGEWNGGARLTAQEIKSAERMG